MRQFFSQAVAYRKSFPRSFWLLSYGRFISVLGNQVSQSTIIVYFTYTLDSAKLVSWVQIIAGVVMVTVLPFGGVLSDKKSRTAIMIWTDIANAALIAALGGLILVEPLIASPELFIALVMLLIAAQAVCHSLFMPAAEAIVPQILGRDNIAGGQKHLVTQNQLAQVIAKAVSGLLFKMFGPAILMFFNSAGYLFSAGLSSGIRAATADKNVSRPGGSLFGLMGEGFKFVRRDNDVRTLFLLSTSVLFFFAPMLMIIPFYLKRELGADEAQLGYLMAALTLGAVLGPASYAKLKNVSKASEYNFLRGLLLFKGLSLSMVFLFKSYYLALFGVLLGGLFSAALSVAIIVKVQQKCPQDYLGRVMSLLYSSANLLQPLSVFACGMLIDQKWILPSQLGIALVVLVTLVPMAVLRGAKI